MIVAGSFYIFPRVNEVWEIALMPLAVAASVAWLLGAFVATGREWGRYYWMSAPVALVQPTYLLFQSIKIEVYEWCRRSCGTGVCWEGCPSREKLADYAGVWEVPVLTFALLSTAVRVAGTLRLLRLASLDIFGQGLDVSMVVGQPCYGSGLQAKDRPMAGPKDARRMWMVPADLKQHIRTEETRAALAKVVTDGAHIFIRHERVASTDELDTSCESDGRGEPAGGGGGERPSHLHVLACLLKTCADARIRSLPAVSLAACLASLAAVIAACSDRPTAANVCGMAAVVGALASVARGETDGLFATLANEGTETALAGHCFLQVRGPIPP